MLCGFEIRSKGVCLSFYWGDYKSPGFNRSNLFLRRIANPPGRLAGFIHPLGGKTAAELQAQSPLALFDELGLRAQLSASRSQGLNALSEAIIAATKQV